MKKATTGARESFNALLTEDTFFSIDYKDLERFLSGIFNIHVEIIEANNDSVYEVKLTDPIDLEDVEEIEKLLLKGEFEAWRLHAVFGWLLHHGYIDAGNFLVNVFW